ncbi:MULTISPECIES: hypothetical protein [Kitasatospora]|uniref:Uncharacterized protein n=1 Tax=Kitasatospora setae (strain ATCC 33774 / DSM 43861 / JCM 3304 / KCC A-0304 / NBRC 14216 / KM-6054) TaxID=452652 RepID=E4N1H9_KITSK|nr:MULTISPECIES: hypothetical protein [Kitasatospora]BAJ32013.1 hypothetical protein KSE_62490 [Kitasatospora setae KM-6054]
MGTRVLDWKGWRVPANGCAWVPLAVWFGVWAALLGSSRGDDAWHWCLVQDHEPLPGRFVPLLVAVGVCVAVMLLIAAPLSRRRGSAWWLWPVLLLTGYALAALYAYGMGSLAEAPPGVEPDCEPMPRWPFGPPYLEWLRSR